LLIFTSFSTAPAPTAIYTLSLHDALPIYDRPRRASQCFERPRDQLAARLGEHLNGDVIGNEIALDQFAHEVEVGLRSGRESDFEDRKSTRLNSSHVKISYAVFCLKKKKKK